MGFLGRTVSLISLILEILTMESLSFGSLLMSIFLVFNPDTVWGENYKKDIEGMENLYFLNKVKNILLLVNKNFSFDKNLSGDLTVR